MPVSLNPFVDSTVQSVTQHHLFLTFWNRKTRHPLIWIAISTITSFMPKEWSCISWQPNQYWNLRMNYSTVFSSESKCPRKLTSFWCIEILENILSRYDDQRFWIPNRSMVWKGIFLKNYHYRKEKNPRKSELWGKFKMYSCCASR